MHPTANAALMPSKKIAFMFPSRKLNYPGARAPVSIPVGIFLAAEGSSS
jgi:hypothetical protein